MADPLKVAPLDPAWWSYPIPVAKPKPVFEQVVNLLLGQKWTKEQADTLRILIEMGEKA